ncbi:MAG: class I SAM-dependent methyltransferase [Deltaproteobacteria bacterium]|nr:class I SAM-dependent methyltransferase [Deltaproteobacteria bacterium]
MVAQTYENRRFSTLRGRLVNARELDAVRRALRCVEPCGSILDLPCGTGRLILPLVQTGLDVWGTDISEQMLAEAKRKLESSGHGHLVDHLGCHDAENLPYPDGKFEGVISLRFMAHLPPEVRQLVLFEMKRVARRWLIVAFNISDPLFVLKRTMRRLFKRQYSAFPVTWRNLSDELAAVGLHQLKVFPVAPWHLSEVFVVLISIDQ